MKRTNSIIMLVQHFYLGIFFFLFNLYSNLVFRQELQKSALLIYLQYQKDYLCYMIKTHQLLLILS